VRPANQQDRERGRSDVRRVVKEQREARQDLSRYAVNVGHDQERGLIELREGWREGAIAMQEESPPSVLLLEEVGNLDGDARLAASAWAANRNNVSSDLSAPSANRHLGRSRQSTKVRRYLHRL